jgi:hypothetical protein
MISSLEQSKRCEPAFYRFKHVDDRGDIRYQVTKEKPNENLISISEVTPLYTESPEHLNVTALVQENAKLWGWITECEQMLGHQQRIGKKF